MQINSMATPTTVEDDPRSHAMEGAKKIDAPPAITSATGRARRKCAVLTTPSLLQRYEQQQCRRLSFGDVDADQSQSPNSKGRCARTRLNAPGIESHSRRWEGDCAWTWCSNQYADRVSPRRVDRRR